MSISFPNRSRSFNSEKGRVQFWGHDGTIEVTFFLDASALEKLQSMKSHTEEGFLAAFDTALARIHSVAAKMYARNRKGVYVCSLTASDF